MTQRLYSIEFLRIVFTFLVILGHCLSRYPNVRESIQSFSGLPFRGTWFSVELFFIIGGFFLYTNLQNNKTSFEQIKKLYSRLAPCLLSLYCLCVVFSIVKIYQAPLVLSLITGVSLPKEITGWGDWYVGVYFWTMIFYAALFKNYSKSAFLIVFIVMYFTMSLQFHAKDTGWVTTYYTIIGSEFVRGLYSIGLGLVVGFLAQNIIIVKNNYTKLFFTIIEIASLLVVFYYLTYMKKFNFLEIEILFGILLFSFANSRGMLSSFCNGILSVQKISKYTYQVFLMHIFPLRLLQKHDSYGLNDITCILIIFSGAIILGILEYHFVEKKFIPYCKMKFFTEKKA